MTNQNPIDTLIFLHIPKAGGSTVHTIIDREYASKYIYMTKGGQQSETEFKNLPLEEKKKLKVLRGHMVFGLHKHMPQTSTYITFLRNPIDRVISTYYYVLRTPNHYLYQTVTSKQMSIEDFIKGKLTVSLDNLQVRLLYGENQYSIPYGKCTPNMLAVAKKNLKESFSVVGLVERFDETLMLLKKSFAWKMPFYTKTNVTKNKPGMDVISKKVIKAIEDDNALDIELYQFAKGLLEEQIASEPSSFDKELKTFKKLNKRYNKTPKLLRGLIFGSQ